MKGYEAITLPDNIDELTLRAVEKGDRYKRKSRSKTKSIMAAASIVIIIFIGIGSNTSALEYLNSVFITIKQAIGMRGDVTGAKHINIKVEDNGVSITAQEIMTDDEAVYISYTVKSEKPFRDTRTTRLTFPTYNRVDFSDKMIESSTLEGKLIDEHTFVGVSTYYLTDIGEEIPKNFILDIEVNSIELDGTNDTEGTVLTGDWRLLVPVELKGGSSKVLTPSSSEGNISVNKIVLGRLNTKIEAVLPKGYIDRFVEIVTDKGTTIRQTNINIKEENDKVQVYSTLKAIPDDTKYIIINFGNTYKLQIELKEKYNQQKIK